VPLSRRMARAWRSLASSSSMAFNIWSFNLVPFAGRGLEHARALSLQRITGWDFPLLDCNNRGPSPGCAAVRMNGSLTGRSHSRSMYGLKSLRENLVLYRGTTLVGP
jgi:hypothetical protein